MKEMLRKRLVKQQTRAEKSAKMVHEHRRREARRWWSIGTGGDEKQEQASAKTKMLEEKLNKAIQASKERSTKDDDDLARMDEENQQQAARDRDRPDEEREELEQQQQDLPYKARFTLEHRLKESTNFRDKNPDRIPVIVERKDADTPNIDKYKFSIRDQTGGQFIHVIRKYIQSPPEKALFFFINDVILPTSTLMSQLYSDHKEEDGNLYISYTYRDPLLEKKEARNKRDREKRTKEQQAPQQASTRN